MPGILSTYRLQLSPSFDFRDLEARAPYLARLGVTHVYLSPILRARADSDHGYDVIDFSTLNPRLGSEADFERAVGALRSHGLGLILDFVPNHMAASSENKYWEDVLAHGRCSNYAHWFDIDWGPPDAPYRIFLPVLGDHLARVIERGELTLEYADADFRFGYFDQSFPIDPATLLPLLEVASERLEQMRPDSEDRLALAAVSRRLRALPKRSSSRPEDRDRRGPEADSARSALRASCRRSTLLEACLRAAVATFNSDARRRRRLLAAQAYRLAYWRRAAREINYRRFFTISHLVGLRMEDERVFADTHSLALDWIRRGWVDGLRLDHIDGLLDPFTYLVKLRRAIGEALPSAGQEFPIYVEKILARQESLPSDWPVSGTTGYEFLNEIEDLFVDPRGFSDVELAYRAFTRRESRFPDVACSSKRRVLSGPLAAECNRLARQLARIARRDSRYDSFDRAQLSQAIVETIARLPVYRTYIARHRPQPRDADRRVITRALVEARNKAPEKALELLSRVLLVEDKVLFAGGQGFDERLDFVQRFQQLSVSAAAKGVEDTAFYVHVPLVSRNEVGGEPGEPPSDGMATLHRANRVRAGHWPDSMLCTSTHDTKRSADVRARIDVLSEVPDLWESNVRRWHQLNRRHRTKVGGRFAPDRNSEYLFYQTLVALWSSHPARDDPFAEPNVAAPQKLEPRLAAYMEKASREAKVQTSWVDPNAGFEEALKRFIAAALDPRRSPVFLTEVDNFVTRIAHRGFKNSLARLVVHLTAPGAPDIYQGDELWDFSLVDPDNRRPVDFDRRLQALTSLEPLWESDPRQRRELLREMMERPKDGRVKLWITHRALHVRRANPELFRRGGYEPLEVLGPLAGHLFAFARRHTEHASVTLAAIRSPGRIAGEPPLGGIWSGTRLRLPSKPNVPCWRCLLSGTVIEADPLDPTVPVGPLLEPLPVALLLPCR